MVEDKWKIENYLPPLKTPLYTIDSEVLVEVEDILQFFFYFNRKFRCCLVLDLSVRKAPSERFMIFMMSCRFHNIMLPPDMSSISQFGIRQC